MECPKCDYNFSFYELFRKDFFCSSYNRQIIIKNYLAWQIWPPLIASMIITVWYSVKGEWPEYWVSGLLLVFLYWLYFKAFIRIQ